jgi:hypothetical protein
MGVGLPPTRAYFNAAHTGVWSYIKIVTMPSCHHRFYLRFGVSPHELQHEYLPRVQLRLPHANLGEQHAQRTATMHGCSCALTYS